MSDNLEVSAELHRDIMNLCCNEFHAGTPNQKEQAAYGRGFKDARHKAAELASEYTSRILASQQAAHDAEIAKLRAQVAMLAQLVADMDDDNDPQFHGHTHCDCEPETGYVCALCRYANSPLHLRANRAAIDTKATAEQFIAECELRGAAKALGDAARIAATFDGDIVQFAAKLNVDAALLRATSKKAGLGL